MKVVMVQNNAVIGVNETPDEIIRAKKTNFENVKNILSPYINEEIDLIILPELFGDGWFPPQFPKVFEQEENSLTLNFLSDLAKTFNSNLVGGSFILKTTAGLKNVCPIFERTGKLIGKYEKIHLFSHYGQDEGKYLTCGNKGLIAKTDIGNLGISTCYDLRFPELFRTYANYGADILINISAWPKSRKNQYRTLIQARAIENQMFCFGVCQTGKSQNGDLYSGFSLAVNPFGDIIKELDETQSAKMIEIDLKEQKSFQKEVSFFKDKKEQYEIEFSGV